MPTVDLCDLCSSEQLTPVYPVPGTARSLVVNVCENCGLVQSLPRVDHVERQSGFPDSGAGFGNIRYGKGFRTQFALDTINAVRPVTEFSRCLDVGANRGSFVLSLHEKAPDIEIDAVEPDERVTEAYESHAYINLIRKRIEHVVLPQDKYDLVYHCHTLEHEAHPLQSLRAIHKAMTADGILFMEVPNIALLERDDLVEEWFIDKHLYHYSADTLTKTLEAAGFSIVKAADPADETNLTIVAQKADSSPVRSAKSLALEEIGRVQAYSASLKSNQSRLSIGAGRLTDYCRKHKVVIWGAGRIFTSLVDIGKFDPTLLAGLVDRNLLKYVKEMYGVAILPPEAIADIAPETVLVASRLYLEEIKQQLAAITKDVDVMTLDDILAAETKDEQ